MNLVIKRNQVKQKFSPSKIKDSIYNAAKDAGLSMFKVKELEKEVAEPVIKHFKSKKSIRASEIRKSILGRLDRRAKSVSSAWRKYDKRKRWN